MDALIRRSARVVWGRRRRWCGDRSPTCGQRLSINQFMKQAVELQLFLFYHHSFGVGHFQSHTDYPIGILKQASDVFHSSIAVRGGKRNIDEIGGDDLNHIVFKVYE